MKVFLILFVAVALSIPLVGWAGDRSSDSDLNGLEKRGRQDRLGLTGGPNRDDEGGDTRGRRGRDDERRDRGHRGGDDERDDEVPDDEDPDMTPTRN